MDTQLFIPTKVKVGFQTRTDTYTQQLAYVIYYDQTGKLRKEKSWNSWCDKKIEPKELDNTPTDGFVLNKGVGGTRSHWNTRSEYIRVYDPRGFEFEISVANLLYILRECDCSKGKGLEGKFVYAWDNNNLVLLPENSVDYAKHKTYTELQGKSVHAKKLIKGAIYTTKKSIDLVYIDRQTVYTSTANLCYVFYNLSSKEYEYLKTIKSVAELKDATIVTNYAALAAKFKNSVYAQKVVDLIIKDTGDEYQDGSYSSNHGPLRYYWSSKLTSLGDTEFYQYNTSISKIQYYSKVSLTKDGIIRKESVHGHYSYGINRPTNTKVVKDSANNLTTQHLFAVLENGTHVLVPYDSSYYHPLESNNYGHIKINKKV